MSNAKRSISGVPLGVYVRKQFAQTWIFRVMRGNGSAGTKLGHIYQHKYGYVVPSSINNAEGQPARDLLTTAVDNWKTVLSAVEKKEYNDRANKGLHMSGYNLYIREYIRANA